MPQPAHDASSPVVKVFTAPGCPHCQAVRTFLGDRDVPFEEIDVSANPGALWQVLGVSGRARVPIVWARRHMVIGFDEQRLEQLLAALAEPVDVPLDLSGPIGRPDDRGGSGRKRGRSRP